MARSRKKKKNINALDNEINSSEKAVWNKKVGLEILRGEMELEFSSFRKTWSDLSKFVIPRRSRFFVEDVNKGDYRNDSIIDSTATMALRTLRSGMMAGITSPARPWFKLGLGFSFDQKSTAAQEWLSNVTKMMSTVFLKSNLYNVLPILYGDIGTFGTGCLFMEEDMDEVIRFYSFPVGSYKIANDAKLRVQVFSREFEMTVRQIIEKFGKGADGEIDWTNISDKVKSLYEAKTYEKRITIAHVIKPNDEYNPERLESKFKKYISVYYERGAGNATTTSFGSNSTGNDGKFLSERGYDYFPVLAPRWETTGEDVYGTNCPALVALGDIKQLQYGEKKLAQAIEKMINPPMVGATSLKQQNASIIAGDITYVDDVQGQRGFRPAHEVNFNIAPMENKQEQVRLRIKKAFFEDLFLMLANSTRREITAREIDERHEEKLLALGPVLEQLNQDLLDPLIDNTFTIMDRQGLIPEPPEEIAGQELEVQYISVMAQAQKLADVSKIEKLTGFVGQLAALEPEALDKLSTDVIIDKYAEMIGIEPALIKTEEMVEELRQARLEAQQQQANMQNIGATVDAAKNLSETSTQEGNVLSDLING
jgi:hypothetical protein